jgi:hypothetical protein
MSGGLLRRQMLRFSRSMPPGPERNERRQIASSLRRLFKSKVWLLHTPNDCRDVPNGKTIQLRRCDNCNAEMTHLSDINSF